jgi:hypothetical protein
MRDARRVAPLVLALEINAYVATRPKIRLTPPVSVGVFSDKDDEPPSPDLADMIAALARADADVAAGRVYSGEAIRQRLRDSIRRMQAEVEPERQ